MTRKDYRAIADAVKNTRALAAVDRPNGRGVDWALDELTYRLADIMEADNPNFSRWTFLSATH